MIKIFKRHLINNISCFTSNWFDLKLKIDKIDIKNKLDYFGNCKSSDLKKDQN